MTVVVVVAVYHMLPTLVWYESPLNIEFDWLIDLSGLYEVFPLGSW